MYKKIQLAHNFFQYQFLEEEGRILGQNIFVLVHKNECIIMDAGYEKHMTQLNDELKGLTIKHVICTHFHPDHCYGLNVLGKQSIIGSNKAKDTLAYFGQSENELLVPNVEISEKTTIDFYTHKITLTPIQGHSNCELLIEVDNTFVLTGDEFMTTNDGAQVLPYVAESIQQHIDSLHFIKENYKDFVLLPSHGSSTKEHTIINRCILYLEFLKLRHDNIEVFYEYSDVRFLSEHWHESNVTKPV